MAAIEFVVHARAGIMGVVVVGAQEACPAPRVLIWTFTVYTGVLDRFRARSQAALCGRSPDTPT